MNYQFILFRWISIWALCAGSCFSSLNASTYGTWYSGKQIAPEKIELSSFQVQSPLPAKLSYIPNFYKKHVEGAKVPIVSSNQVPDYALIEAARLAHEMLLYRPDIAKKLTANKVRIVVMSKNEQTTDIPEHSDLTPKSYWDARARGLGATFYRPASSVGEENLLAYPDDRYLGESIFIHEFAHTIHLLALKYLDSTFDQRLRNTYQQAIAKGLWVRTYSASNYEEYWAEGVQSYFNANRSVSPPNGIHNEIATRVQLQYYDPDLASLIEEVFKQ